MDQNMDDESQQECALLGGAFAVLLQALLAIAALSTLFYKRMIEHPKRPLIIWFYDVSKQGIGALILHSWNLALSIWIAKFKNTIEGDECAVYFVQFFLDVVLGTALIWALVEFQHIIASRFHINSLKDSGYYGMPPIFKNFLAQLVAYVFIIVSIKTLLAFLVIALDHIMEKVATAMFLPIQSYPDIELTVVMVICPWILNSLQFWVLDNIVMDRVHIGENDASLNQYKRIDGAP